MTNGLFFLFDVFEDALPHVSDINFQKGTTKNTQILGAVTSNIFLVSFICLRWMFGLDDASFYVSLRRFVARITIDKQVWRSRSSCREVLVKKKVQTGILEIPKYSIKVLSLKVKRKQIIMIYLNFSLTRHEL